MKTAVPVDMKSADDRQALISFVVANTDLEALEGLLAQFNIFDAIGVARQELRHSDFLAFLLDPRQNHGLGDAFLKRFLQMALVAPDQSTASVGAIELDVWSLDQAVVAREWRNIDILITDEAHRFAVIVENKIGSTEHSGQLSRYMSIVRNEYPGWRILPLYLTPEGDAPSENEYLAVDYELVCSAVELLADSRRAVLDPAMYALMGHYVRMVRREVVADSEIAELCRTIYQKHKRALDLIIEHRPSAQDELARLLEALVSEDETLVLLKASRGSVLFVDRAWETPLLKSGEDSGSSGRMLLFEFINKQTRLDLQLLIGPGPIEIRQRLVDRARKYQPPFTVAPRETRMWTQIFKRKFLLANELERASFEELEPQVSQRWEQFLEMDLPAIIDAMHVEGLTN